MKKTDNGTTMSVDRAEALKENLETIKGITLPTNEKNGPAVLAGSMPWRLQIAAMAMQGMNLKDRGYYSENELKHGYHLSHPKWVADAALDYADALLKEFEKETR